MRHLKADVSHRIKRRPSIFTAGWFRMILGLGVVVILGLTLGPSVTGWLRGDGQPSPQAARATPKPPAPRPAAPAGPGTPKPAAAPTEAPRPESTIPAAAVRPEAAAPAPSTVPPVANGTGSTTEPARPAAATGAARGPAVYRIQMGAFLDHRNADRLIERLRTEGVEVVNTTIEETRTLYRVLALPQDGEAYAGVVDRLRRLGYTPEPTEGGAVVTRPAPLAPAVELSRRLREQGIRVRLEKQTSAAGFRVVRVGAYDTAEEAERARTALAGRGYEGIVVRESR